MRFGLLVTGPAYGTQQSSSALQFARALLDEGHSLYMRLNKEQVLIDTLTEAHDIEELRCLITEHVAATGSPKGKKILAAFNSYIPCFKKIMPRDYDRMLRSIAKFEEKGLSREQAELEAFCQNTKA